MKCVKCMLIYINVISALIFPKATESEEQATEIPTVTRHVETNEDTEYVLFDLRVSKTFTSFPLLFN